MNSSKATCLYILILIPLIYFAIFLHLDSLPFRVWDESYLATHTYEMMHDHDYIVTHSFGSPEMWNTKPPFVIWCMLISCKLFGFNELAIRLPNAFAGVAICVLMFVFCARILKSSFKGFLSVVILVSCAGFIRLHVTRSGEYDAFLVLFVTSYCLCYFILLENIDKRQNALWVVFTLLLILAILTKGIAAVLVVPVLFIYTILQKKLLPILKLKETYLSVTAIILFGVGYYLLREHYNPGYIQAVSVNELGGRFLNPQMKTSPWEYIDAIVNLQFRSWLPLAFIGIFAGLFLSKGLEQRITVFSVLIIVFLLTLLSCGSTRLDWYDAPIFPFLGLLSAIGVSFITSAIFKASVGMPIALRKMITPVLIILFTVPSYAQIIIENLHHEEDPWDKNAYNLTHYIEIKERGGISLNGYKIVNDSYMWVALRCQVRKWTSKGQKITILEDVQNLQPNDKVIVSMDAAKSEMDRLYKHESVDIYKNVEVWRILGPKLSKDN